MPSALLIGLPSCLVMRRRHWDRLRACLFLGFGLGAFFVALFASLVSFVLACAVASTLVFWSIVRPDLHRPWQAAGKTRAHGR